MPFIGYITAERERRSTVEELAELVNGRVVTAAAQADLADRETEFLAREPGTVIGRCVFHPMWRAVRDGDVPPLCPQCAALREEQRDLAEYVRRVFA